MTVTGAIRILVVDDHPAVRRGVTSFIHDCPDMTVVAEASSGEEAIAAFRQHRPDVTLMDLRMTGMNGLEATAAIHQEFPDARIIILTTFGGDADISRAMASSARGYLLKSMLPDEYLSAIRRVHAGKRAIPAEVAMNLAVHLDGEPLTAREVEILELAAAGEGNQEIGERPHLSKDTVKSHMSRILAKLDACDRTHAVTIAVQRGIIHI